MAVICREHKLLFIMVPGTGCSVVGRALRQKFGGKWLPERDVREDGKAVVQHKHNTLPEILQYGLLTEEERAEYLVFAAVRNPFDRWVTYYQRYAGEWVDDYHGFLERQIERERKEFDLSRTAYKRRLAHRDYQMRKHARRRRIIRMIGFNNWMKVTLLRWYLEGKNDARETGRLRPYAFPMLQGVDVVIRQEQLEEGLNEVLRIVGVEKQISLPKKNVTPGKKPYTEYYTASTRFLAEYLLGDVASSLGYEFQGLVEDAPVVWLNPERKPAIR